MAELTTELLETRSPLSLVSAPPTDKECSLRQAEAPGEPP